mmetsp:Transcript_2013/g.6084  ORF Transcript_2013/g.6084 Transcript_2013/m.6084 type:complete len:203 (+) Transcript_2013:637-1245(+)
MLSQCGSALRSAASVPRVPSVSPVFSSTAHGHLRAHEASAVIIFSRIVGPSNVDDAMYRSYLPVVTSFLASLSESFVPLSEPSRSARSTAETSFWSYWKMHLESDRHAPWNPLCAGRSVSEMRFMKWKTSRRPRAKGRCANQAASSFGQLSVKTTFGLKPGRCTSQKSAWRHSFMPVVFTSRLQSTQRKPVATFHNLFWPGT